VAALVVIAVGYGVEAKAIDARADDALQEGV
jgi:hypothetical protein